MGISRTPKEQTFPYRAVEEIEPKVQRYSTLPTAANVKARKLFGIPLTSTLTGETIADETIEHYIEAAISEIEHVLDLYITPVTFYEKHDYSRHSFTWSYNYMKVDHSPILDVESVELSFSNNSSAPGFVQFPLEFVHTQPQEGTVQLVPAFGTSTSGFLLSAFSGTQFHALRSTGITDFPGGIRIKYTAGFCPNKIPVIITELIETIAALALLSMLGPIFFTNTSVSIGLDGASQSTGNMGPRHFSDRITNLEKMKEIQFEAVKGYYNKRFLVDFF